MDTRNAPRSLALWIACCSALVGCGETLGGGGGGIVVADVAVDGAVAADSDDAASTGDGGQPADGDDALSDAVAQGDAADVAGPDAADPDSVDAAPGEDGADGASDGDAAPTDGATDAAAETADGAAPDAVADAGTGGDLEVAEDVAPDPGAELGLDAATDAAVPTDASAADADDAAADGGADAAAEALDGVGDSQDAGDSGDAAAGDVGPACKSVADCGGSTPYCAAGQCVACEFNVQCPGDGAICSKHVCVSPVKCVSDKDCTPLGAVCDAKAGVCRECLSATDCKPTEICAASQCQAKAPCVSSKECPGALVCASGQCSACAADADCEPSQFCGLGVCIADLCGPGSHCENNTLVTCKPNGGGWDAQACGTTAVCLVDTCAPVVCAPSSVACSGASLATCNATGTELTVAPCPSNQTCVGNACTAVICTPKAKLCDAAGGLLTCSSDGTAWTVGTCGGGQVCGNGGCTTPICAPGNKTCSGPKLLVCNNLGLAWEVTATCSDGGNVCVKDACVPPLCQPGSIACDGVTRQICNADGMGWTPSSCDDGDGCTADSCNPTTAACVHAALDCNDSNPCTADSCSGTCKHAALAGGPCEDGNACTSNETCDGGKCVAPLGSAAVATIAGSGAAGNTNGPGSSASFTGPFGLARLGNGSFLVSEWDGNRIRQVKADGSVSAFAGTGTAGSGDGAALAATFFQPAGMAVNAADEVFVADYGGSRLRKIAGGTVTTFAGSSAGFADGKGAAAQFWGAIDVKFDAKGVLWIADQGNHRIRRALPDGTITTAAGDGTAGYLDGDAASARFYWPCAVAPASDGSVFVADCSNYRIRKLSADGKIVSTVAGSGNGYIDGPGTSAKFSWVAGLAVLGNTLIVADRDNNRIRTIAQDGVAGTLAGSGSAAYVDGAPSSAAFWTPSNVALDWSGAVWITDKSNNRIRKLTLTYPTCDDGNPCTTDSCSANKCSFGPVTAGTPCSDGTACSSGDACDANGKCSGTLLACSDGNACTADGCDSLTGACSFSAMDGACDDSNVCTNSEHCVGGTCKADTAMLVTVAGSATAGFIDGPGKDARFDGVFGLAPTKSGGVYVGDASGNRIRLVTADGTTLTAAGTGTAGYLDGAATSALFNNPTRLLLDAAGTSLYIADSQNNRIRKLVGSTVSTVAGSGSAGFQDGAPTSAKFYNPFAMVFGPGGVIYVADSQNHRIRTIASDGTVGTLAGTATSGSSDGAVGVATFNSPRGLCMSGGGILYVVDTLNNNIRRIFGGQVDTFAGGGPGSVDGVGTAAGFDQPRDCSVDAAGNVWVADTYSNRLRRISPSGVVTTVAGATIGGGSTLTGTDGAALTSVLAYPTVPAWVPGGAIWIADSNAIRKFIPATTDCADGQPCTTDACNPTTGACSNTATANGGSCDDGLPCTVAEICSGGSCGGGANNTCDDKETCTTDACDALAGCSHAWQYTLPGCCKPILWQTGFEDGTGTDVSLATASGTTYDAWDIGATNYTHTGGGGLGINYLYGNAKQTATLPTFPLPSGTTTLTFWLYMDAAPSVCNTTYGYLCGSATFAVYVNGVAVYSKSNSTAGWIQVSVTSQLAAGTSPVVSLAFVTAGNATYGYTYSSNGVGVYVDDIQVASTCQ